MSHGLHSRRPPLAQITVRLLWVQKHDTRLQPPPCQRGTQLTHRRVARHLRPRPIRRRWRATQGQSATRQLVRTARHGYRTVDFESNRRQPRPRARKRHPTPIDYDGAAIGTVKWGQHFVSRVAVVGPLVQEKLELRLETPDEGHSLESGHLLNAARSQRDSGAGTLRELRPLRFACVSASPLPDAEAG